MPRALNLPTSTLWLKHIFKDLLVPDGIFSILACSPIYPHSCVEFRVEVLPRVGRWSKGAGRGALSLLRRTVPLQLCKLIRRQRTETRMRARMIIIKSPGFDDLPRFGQAVEQVFVQALVA